MKPWKTLETIRDAGAELLLQERDGEYVLRADGQVLMGSRQHGSEDALAKASCADLKSPTPRVLIGGLGFGYTLRAALDVLPAQARVTVVELVPQLVTWNRQLLAPLAGRPLEDARVRVEVADVRQVLKSAGDGIFEVVMLDVDNGPRALTRRNNSGLYDSPGLAEAHRVLSPQGLFAVWSAGPDAQFARRLAEAGFRVGQRPAATMGAGGGRHVLFLGRRS